MGRQCDANSSDGTASIHVVPVEIVALNIDVIHEYDEHDADHAESLDRTFS